MYMRLKARVSKSLAVVLSISLLFSLQACVPLIVYDLLASEGDPVTNHLELPVYETNGIFKNYDFDGLCEALFEHEVTMDNLLLNQCVTDPEALAIEVPRPATLGDYSIESIRADNQFYSEVLDALKNSPTIIIDRLSPQQQREAAYIKSILEITLYLEEFYYYEEPLRPSVGAQAMLPLSLMDYIFRTADDVDIYIEILEDVPRHFNQLLAHEEEKFERQLFMPLESLDASIEEARAYTGALSSHILVKTFNEMLDEAVEAARATGGAAGGAIDGAAVNAAPVAPAINPNTQSATDADEAQSDLAKLTTEQIQDYKDRNAKALEEFLIPAYNDLVDRLEIMRAYAVSGTRLYDLPQGRDYYALTMQAMGFDETPGEAIQTLERSLKENLAILDEYGSYWDDAALRRAVEAVGEKPEDFIEFVRARSVKEFAGVKELNYSIRTAPDASPNDYAMAYFLIPPVDDPQTNTIVFFPRNIANEVEFFSTVAHEGYPGHMYHFFAISLEEPSNIMKILGSSAFIEGWAMYAQSYAMHYLDADYKTIEAYNAYDRFAYGLQARVDLGVNYEGWTLDDTQRYLQDYGLSSAAKEIFDTSLKQPVAYLPYGLGLVKFRDLRSQAESSLGTEFDPLVYHQLLTGFGPLPFDMLDAEMDAWLKANTSNSQRT